VIDVEKNEMNFVPANEEENEMMSRFRASAFAAFWVFIGIYSAVNAVKYWSNVSGIEIFRLLEVPYYCSISFLALYYIYKGVHYLDRSG
jgi:hypothetical protein